LSTQSKNATTHFLLDFLDAKPLRVLVHWRLFPVLLQMAALVALVALAINGLGLGLDLSADELLTFRKTHLTTLVVWGLWWPGMIALALTLGRAWCTVCPLELVSRMGDALARKVGWPRARMGKLLRAGWVTLLIYLAMQLLVAGLSMHRIPHATALMLIALVSLAFLAGLVFAHPRSFCVGFCPAAALLSVYGRYTPVQLSERDPSVCRGCKKKECIEASNRHRFDGRSCPSLLRPYARAPSDACVLCLQCVKVCPHDNMSVGVLSEHAPIREKALLRPFEAAFVMIALGFVAHEVIGEVKWLDVHFHAVPTYLNALLPWLSFGWLEAAWFLIFFPLLVWAMIGGVGLLLGQRQRLRPLLLAAATGAAPVVALAHLAKAVAKMGSWGGFLPLAIRDPGGVETFRAIASGSLSAPELLISLSLVGWLMLLAAVVIGWRAWRWAGELPAESAGTARVAFAFSGIIFSAVLVVWTLPTP